MGVFVATPSVCVFTPCALNNCRQLVYERAMVRRLLPSGSKGTTVISPTVTATGTVEADVMVSVFDCALVAQPQRVSDVCVDVVLANAAQRHLAQLQLEVTITDCDGEMVVYRHRSPLADGVKVKYSWGVQLNDGPARL